MTALPDEARPGDFASPRPRTEGARAGRIELVGALFLLTIVVYWLLGPQQTPYDYQLSQANNLIHGHLDLVPEYTRNLGVLERVLYDGIGFCLPIDDPRGPGPAAEIVNPRITADCRTYMQHALGPAVLLIPLVLVWGMSVNQTLISVLVAGLTAPLVFAVARRFSLHLPTRLALTVLVMFGTILWFHGANGGVWSFAHTTAVFFLFGAIYATVVLRSPLAAGALVGAAFMCRPTTILAGFFPLVALSDQWLVAGTAGRPTKVRIRPLVELAVGVLPFIAATMTVNYLRFDNPFEAGYNYSEEFHQLRLQRLWSHGVFDPSYIPRHMAVSLAQMPIFAPTGSFVWPSWAGLAMWVTTPPLLAAFFVHLKARRRVAIGASVAIALACAALLTRAAWTGLVAGGPGPLGSGLPPELVLAPFWAAAGLAIAAAVAARDRLAIGCWAAIVPIALADWLFAATGWAQFGYRYGLDFLPFLIVLVAMAIGRRVRPYQLALIALAVAVNLWGVLWIYRFDPAHLWGWTWVSF